MITDKTLKDHVNSCKDEICDGCGSLLDESQDFVLYGKNEEILLCLSCDEMMKRNKE